ncbi:MAG: cell surface protein SprA, partial [Bacteroidia bacterium]|nr:cell surface protein SprA [Bacteroidia bacterium]
MKSKISILSGIWLLPVACVAASSALMVTRPSAGFFTVEDVTENAVSESVPEKKVSASGKTVNLLQFKALNKLSNPPDSTGPGDTAKGDLKYPIKDKKPHEPSGPGGNIDLKDPQEKNRVVKFNSETGRYEIYKKTAGGLIKTDDLSREQFLKQTSEEEKSEYFKQRSRSQAGNVSGGGGGNKPKLIKIPDIGDKLFRGGIIDIQPSGSAELTFGGNFNTVRNPQFSARQQKTGQFDFDQKIQLNVNGKIGNALNLNIKYDTDATFDFENQTKLNWVGKEDQSLKKVELGNVSLPLNGSLISSSNSLFGIKTAWQFGRLGMTVIATQNKGQRTETEVSGGSQITEFSIQADNYDANRHFFLSQFFRNQFNSSLTNLPVVTTGIKVTRIEVWVTNRSGDFNNTRDILSLMDLGEADPNNPAVNDPTVLNPAADNNANRLYGNLTSPPNESRFRSSATVIDALNSSSGFPNLQQGLDYDLLTYGKQLFEGTDFTFNTNLGYVSLNSSLNNDEMLCVAYEYTDLSDNKNHKVGEFATDVQNSGTGSSVLMLKMLKGTTIRTRLPIWNLMMKNIYSLGSYNINPADLKLNVIYQDDPSGADLNYLPVKDLPGVEEGTPLLRLLNLDRINRQGENKPDGVYDAIETLTIQSSQGRVIFPVLEPFGDRIRQIFGNTGNNPILANKYAFDALYDSTKLLAGQDAFHNKFVLRGSYKGTSSSDISLNALNVPQGSVIVTANGNRLTEGTDYTVDYSAGRVTITNQGILQSGAVIRVSAESNSLFNIQQKTLLGARFDYKVNNNLLLGGTVLHMYERALTPKTNIGEEPLLNTVVGGDVSYTKKSPFLTRLVDRLPFIETKEASLFTFTGEYAQIFPGKAKSFGKQRGVSYIDDFEGAETNFDLRQPSNWKLASLPQKQPDLFPEWNIGLTNKMPWNDYRGKIAWYSADQTFLRDDNFTPANIKGNSNMRSDHYMRQILVKDVFPNKQLQQGSPTILPTLDMAYFPKERGMYNYNGNTSDLNSNGTFVNPSRNWGGIMRRIETNDFEAANIDY